MRLRDNRLIAFGQHLLKYMDVDVKFTDNEWDAIMATFENNIRETIPGLMYINWVSAKYYNRDPLAVRYKETGRKGEDVLARQVVFYIATRYYKYTLGKIAEFYEGMNHATVIHGRNKIEGLITGDHVDRKLKQEVEDIIYEIRGYSYDIDQDERTDSEGELTGISEATVSEEDT